MPCRIANILPGLVARAHKRYVERSKTSQHDASPCCLNPSGTPSRHTAVLCDRERLWLDAAQHVLHRMEIEVVGRTHALEEALRLVRKHHPDLLVVDVYGSGFSNTDDYLRRIAARLTGGKLIVLSAVDDPVVARRALAGGAAAYVVKSEKLSDLDFAVRQALHRSIYLPLGDSGEPSSGSGEPGPSLLTARELEILRLAAEGASNPEVARRLWITEQTVKFHLTNVFRKLGVSSRADAARWARAHGVVDDGRRASGS
jgi:DNA-binding NarL/FixJ family response regulator